MSLVQLFKASSLKKSWVGFKKVQNNVGKVLTHVLHQFFNIPHRRPTPYPMYKKKDFVFCKIVHNCEVQKKFELFSVSRFKVINPLPSNCDIGLRHIITIN